MHEHPLQVVDVVVVDAKEKISESTAKEQEGSVGLPERAKEAIEKVKRILLDAIQAPVVVDARYTSSPLVRLSFVVRVVVLTAVRCLDVIAVVNSDCCVWQLDLVASSLNGRAVLGVWLWYGVLGEISSQPATQRLQ